MLRKIITYPFILLWILIFYPVLVFRVMRKKHEYERDKKRAWQSFYSMNRKWLHSWYSEKGLDSKPPVFYDQNKKQWFKLNRKLRRTLSQKQRMTAQQSKANH